MREELVARYLTEEEKVRYKERNIIGFDYDGKPVTHSCYICGGDTRYWHKDKWYCLDHFLQHRNT